ncbi:MAG: DUF1223 domain-containing protein [Bacteroidota bacterium]
MNMFLPLFISLLLSFQGEPASTPTVAVESTGIAVVELFTSQGCSSCPPADAHLAKLVEKAAKEGIAIFPLSFHVDYWNYLGWKDPYSTEAYSERQYAYARGLGERVYTPQMIINGKHVFVGSDQRKGELYLKKALSMPATHALSLDISSANKGTVKIDYTIEGKLNQYVLNLAVVQNGISDKVSRGENRGRTLKHSHVVQKFQTLSLGKATGTTQLDIPANISNASIIAYVQHKESFQIGGASLLKLPGTVN